MVFSRRISDKERAYVHFLRNEKKHSIREISRIINVSPSSVSRIYREGISPIIDKKRSSSKMGRPRLFTPRDRKQFLRTFLKMRTNNPNVTTVEVGREAGIAHVSNRTLVRALNEENFYRLGARKKGILSAEDRKKRVEYARRVLKELTPCYWYEDVLMYLDGVSFVHKRNPFNEAVSARGRVYRRKNEGLQITAKGSKNLAGGKRLHFLVGITSAHGVTMIESYDKMDGKFFARFIHNKLRPRLIELAELKKKRTLTFVMDNDPSQTSRLALQAMEEAGVDFLSIPPRSPDLNPIENIFHLVRVALRKDALERNINNETIDDFEARIRYQLKNVSLDALNKTISTMEKRLRIIKNNKGYRTKY